MDCRIKYYFEIIIFLWRLSISAKLNVLNCDAYFSIHRNYLANPNGEDVRKWITNDIWKFHSNTTVNEFGIIVLLRQFWVSVKKEKATMQRVFLSTPIYFRNSQWWECSEMSSKPSAQISRRSNSEWVWDRHFS